MRNHPRSVSLRLGAVIALSTYIAAYGVAAGRQDHGMMHSVRSEYDFIAEMIPHHQEAVDTASEVVTRTERPELRGFAAEIVRVQSAEIETMRSWLASWYPARSGRSNYRPMMRPTAGLSVERADRAFLEDMIMHHRMAVMMAQSLLAGRRTDREEVILFAQSIIETQNAEIEQMETWLREWYGVTAAGHMGH